MAASYKSELKRLEAALHDDQIEAARLLAINHFLPRKGDYLYDESDPRRRMTYEEIAKEVGISKDTLYLWRTRNKDFIDYVNLLAQQVFSSHMPSIMEKHLEMILKGQGSMKGIELFYKVHGMLVDRQEVKHENVEVDTSLDEMLAKLRDRANDVENED